VCCSVCKGVKRVRGGNLRIPKESKQKSQGEQIKGFLGTKKGGGAKEPLAVGTGDCVKDIWYK